MSNTDYDNNDVKIITKPVQSQNPVLIEGFPGIGLVGNIASQHIIEELRMEYIGSIDSRYFPSIAVLYEGLINMPVRIYEKVEHNLIVVISDIPISHTVSYDVSNALVDWAESINVREIASIAGIPRCKHSAITLPDIPEIVPIWKISTLSLILLNISGLG